MNRERPTFVEFCSGIPTCVIVSNMFFTMGNREFYIVFPYSFKERTKQESIFDLLGMRDVAWSYERCALQAGLCPVQLVERVYGAHCVSRKVILSSCGLTVG